MHPYTYLPQDTVLNQIIFVSDGYGIEFERFYSLNQSEVTLFAQPTSITISAKNQEHEFFQIRGYAC